MYKMKGRKNINIKAITTGMDGHKTLHTPNVTTNDIYVN